MDPASSLRSLAEKGVPKRLVPCQVDYNRLEMLKYKHKLMEKYTQWFKETFELLVERRVRAWERSRTTLESSEMIHEVNVIRDMFGKGFRMGEYKDLIAERVDLLADVIFSVDGIKGSMWLQMLPYLAEGFSRSQHFPRRKMDQYVKADWKEYFGKMPEKFGGYVRGRRTYSFFSYPQLYLFAFRLLCPCCIHHTP